MAVASEAKELLTLCRTGRLYDIEKWIAEGKPLEMPVSRNARKKTLEVAVETGFHSLVELIAKHDNSQPSKNAALETAVSQSRLDLIELLVANGAEVTSMPFADVLLNWEAQEGDPADSPSHHQGLFRQASVCHRERASVHAGGCEGGHLCQDGIVSGR